MSWSTLHGTALDATFKALTAKGIPWLVLRNHAGLPWRNASKDIDIGIEQHRLREAEIVVEGVMQAHGFDRKETQVFQWGRCTSYFGVVDGAAVSIKIDLMDGFSWRTAGLFDSARLMERAMAYEEFLIPDPTDDATIMWLKPLMTGGWVKPAYVPGITEGVTADPARFRANLDRLFRPDLAALAWQHLERGEYEALTAHSKRLSWNAWAREVASRPGQSAKNMFSYVFLELLRRSRRPRATYFAVLGPDSAEKAAFVAALRAELARLQAKDPDVIELEHVALCGARTPEAGAVLALAGFARCWLRAVSRYWSRIRRRCIRGRTVLTDADPYAALVAAAAPRSALHSAAVTVFRALTPRPDLTFLVDIGAQTTAGPQARTTQRGGQRENDLPVQQAQPDRFLAVDPRLDPHENARNAAAEIVKWQYRHI